MKDRQRKNLPGRVCREAVYKRWALKLLTARVGFTSEATDSPKYGWPPSFLKYIRALEPENVAGNDHQATYHVTYKELCETLLVPRNDE